MNFCPNCGANLNPTKSECEYCGTPLSGMSQSKKTTGVTSLNGTKKVVVVKRTTEQLSTPAPQPVSAPPQKPEVSNTYVWLLAMLPLATAWMVTYLIGGVIWAYQGQAGTMLGDMADKQVAHFEMMSVISTLVAIVLNIIFVVKDTDEIERTGRKSPSGWWVLLVPIYLILRANKVDKNWGYVITWLIFFIIDCCLPY